MALLIFVQESLQDAARQRPSHSRTTDWNSYFFLCTFVVSLMEAALGQNSQDPGSARLAEELTLSPTQMLAHKCLSLLGKTTIFSFFATFFDFYRETLATGLALPFHHFVALEAAHLLTIWCSQSFSTAQLGSEDPLGDIREKIEALLSHAPPPSESSSLVTSMLSIETEANSPLKYLFPYLAAMPAITPHNGIGETLDLSARSLTSYRLTRESQLLVVRLTHLYLPRLYHLLLQGIGIIDETGSFLGGELSAFFLFFLFFFL